MGGVMPVILFSVVFAALPVLFLPFTQDFYETPKWTLYVLVILISIGVWGFQTLRAHRNRFIVRWSPAIAFGATLSAVSFLSLIAASHNKGETLAMPLGPATIMGTTILLGITSHLFDERAKTLLRRALYGSGSIIALMSLYQFVGLGKLMFPSVAYLHDPLWTPTGSSVVTIAILAILLPLVLDDLVASIRQKEEVETVLLLAGLVVMATGMAALVIRVIPKAPTLFLSPIDGWKIALETIKTPKAALLGIGAENFVTAYTLGKPEHINLTPFWNLRFTTNASLLLHAMTIYGLPGALVVAAGLVWTAIKALQRITPASISMLLAVLAVGIVPPNMALVTFLTAMVVATGEKRSNRVIPLPDLTALRYALGGAIALIVVAASYVVVRAYVAEHVFYQSLLAASQNNGTNTYNLQIRAIRLNPFVSRFRISYSQTCLGLASSLTQAIATALKDTPEQTQESVEKDRQLATELIQQGIREAKIAAGLNPYSVLAWENLARTYQNLTTVAQGADRWAIASYQQAIRLDPTNPILYLELGSVYVGQGAFDDAVQQFNAAISLKQDYVNAYYNLANAYKLKGDAVSALAAVEKTLQYLTPGTSDYEKAKTMEAQLKK